MEERYDDMIEPVCDDLFGKRRSRVLWFLERVVARDEVCVDFPERSIPSNTMSAPRLLCDCSVVAVIFVSVRKMHQDAVDVEVFKCSNYKCPKASPNVCHMITSLDESSSPVQVAISSSFARCQFDFPQRSFLGLFGTDNSHWQKHSPVKICDLFSLGLCWGRITNREFVLSSCVVLLLFLASTIA